MFNYGQPPPAQPGFQGYHPGQQQPPSSYYYHPGQMMPHHMQQMPPGYIAQQQQQPQHVGQQGPIFLFLKIILKNFIKLLKS